MPAGHECTGYTRVKQCAGHECTGYTRVKQRAGHECTGYTKGKQCAPSHGLRPHGARGEVQMLRRAVVERWILAVELAVRAVCHLVERVTHL